MDKEDLRLRALRRAVQQRGNPTRGRRAIVGDPEYALAMAVKHHQLSRQHAYSAAASKALPGREPITGSTDSYRIRIMGRWLDWGPIANALSAEVDWGDRQRPPNDLAKFLLSEQPEPWEYALAKPSLTRIIAKCPELRALFGKQQEE